MFSWDTRYNKYETHLTPSTTLVLLGQSSSRQASKSHCHGNTIYIIVTVIEHYTLHCCCHHCLIIIIERSHTSKCLYHTPKVTAMSRILPYQGHYHYHALRSLPYCHIKVTTMSKVTVIFLQVTVVCIQVTVILMSPSHYHMYPNHCHINVSKSLSLISFCMALHTYLCLVACIYLWITNISMASHYSSSLYGIAL